MKIKLENFGGMQPIVGDTLLPDTAASYSENAWVYSGELHGLRENRLIKALNSGTRYVHRIPLSETQPYNYSNSFYMEFTDPDVKVVKSPVFDDSHKRLYWAAPTQTQPLYNTRARILASSDPYKLGIPAPSTAPSGVVTGGSTGTVDRVYVTTWVSLYGEEGPPSDPVTINGFSDGSWDLTLVAPTAGELLDRALDKVRIYRTVTSLTGVPVFTLVTELDKATTAYSDTATDADVIANNLLESFEYYEPPTDLTGLVAMANGVLAGWRENEIWFSEPYKPHAWPPSYALTLQYPVVACGVVGQTLIVTTRGNPVAITGINPANMSMAAYMAFEPCLSRQSLIATEDGVYYASHNGLINVSPAGLVNVTRELIERRDWLVEFNAEFLYGARLNSAYFGFGSAESGAFEPTAFESTAFEMSEFVGTRNGFYLDPKNQRAGVNMLVEEVPVLSVQEDAWSGDIFIVGSDYNLYVMDPSDESGRRTYKWRSKSFQMPEPKNFGALKVRFLPTPQAFSDVPFTLDGDGNPDVESYGYVRVYADGVEVSEHELEVSGRIERLPSGFLAEFWTIELEARVDVLSVEIASTPRELADV